MTDERWPIPWRRNIAIILAAVACDVVCLVWAAQAISWYELVLAGVLFSFSNHTLFALGHEAVHGVLFRHRRLNDGVGSVLAATFPQSFALQRAFHLCHHRCNRTDSEFFDGIAPGDNAWIKRIQWYGILVGEYWLRIPLGCLLWLCVPWLVRRAILRDTTRTAVRSWGGWSMLDALASVPPWRSRLEIVWAIVLHAAIISGLMGGNWRAWAVCYGLFALNWGSLQYATHAFSERSVRDGAFDLRAPWWLRCVLLDYHFHLAHHRHPAAPWTNLASLVDEQRERPTFWRQYLRMWRGPRPAWGVSPRAEAPAAHDPDQLPQARMN